ncbi:MAG: hypothetical protein AMJ55_13410 [Gammaproteobacteria bacterium SG8_15]|nr:MAG: hypothetical protein AMJ55_13410 [Gammaproteobacteria bacterium SG8_15]
MQFIKVAPDHRWSTHLASNFNIQPPSLPTQSAKKPASRQLESVAGVQIGLYLDELPTSLGTPRIKKFAIADSRISLLEYPDGISIVAEGDEVRIIVASEKFHTRNQQGINIGSTRHSVISNYGLPDLRLNSTRGQNLLYPRDGVSFQLADDKVTSWAVY